MLVSSTYNKKNNKTLIKKLLFSHTLILICTTNTHIKALESFSSSRKLELKENNDVSYKDACSCHQTLVGERESCFRRYRRMVFQLLIQNAKGLNKFMRNFVFDCKPTKSSLA